MFSSFLFSSPQLFFIFYLRVDRIEQCRLSMRVARTSRSWKMLHTLVARCRTMGCLVKKAGGRLGWPAVLWTRSARVHSVVDVCAGEQRSRSSSLLHVLLLVGVRHRHCIVIRKGEIMSLKIKCQGIMEHLQKHLVSNQLLRETDSRTVTCVAPEWQLRPRACDTLPISRFSLLSYSYKIQS